MLRAAFPDNRWDHARVPLMDQTLPGHFSLEEVGISPCRKGRERTLWSLFLNPGVKNHIARNPPQRPQQHFKEMSVVKIGKLVVAQWKQPGQLVPNPTGEGRSPEDALLLLRASRGFPLTTTLSSLEFLCLLRNVSTAGRKEASIHLGSGMCLHCSRHFEIGIVLSTATQGDVYSHHHHHHQMKKLRP